MINDNSPTISLSDLIALDSIPKGVHRQNLFATYSRHQQTRESILLQAIDTKKIPQIPMRRIGCEKCINKGFDCYNCKDCLKSPCCRNLACIFDYTEWKRNSQNPIQKKQCLCPNTNKKSGFSIDWRLMGIIEKLGKVKQGQQAYLCFGGGMLWGSILREQELVVFHEDNFGVSYFHERQTKDGGVREGGGLRERNVRGFTEALERNVKKYLQSKETWEISNLEEECGQIAQDFETHRKFEGLRKQLQSQPSDNPYSNMPSIKYQGKYLQVGSFVQVKGLKQKDYKGCSDLPNQYISFYYCPKSKLLFIRNATYYTQKQGSNIRGVCIQFNQGQQGFQRAIWFKDRRGDIFAIRERYLSIFRYYKPENCFKEFQLYEDSVFATVKSPAALLYIPQKDIVYYFNSEDFKRSFYFQLYRGKIEDNKGKNEEGKGKRDDVWRGSCTKIKLYKDGFIDKEKSVRSGKFCKATYVMEDFKFKKGKQKERKELIPVIYLLVQRNNYLPIGVGMYRIVQAEEILIKEIPNQSSPIAIDRPRTINFDKGLFFILRLQKVLHFCYYSLAEGRPTLLSARISEGDDKESLLWSQDYLELNGCSQLNSEASRSQNEITNYMINCDFDQKEGNKFPTIYINDLAGVAGNNQMRIMGGNLKTGRVMQACLTYASGVPVWSCYDLH